MTPGRLRRDIRLLKFWATVSSMLLMAIAGAAFTGAGAPPRNLGEITVERVNVVDHDGTLRMVIAGQDRMHPGVMDGVTIDRPRPVAGLIFFNDQGDEVGGLAYTGQEKNGVRTADASLMFDQLKQDQTIGISYSEKDGKRSAAFHVWDRADQHLSDLIRKLNAANRLTDPAAKQAAIAAARASAPKGAERVFVGKQTDRSALVSLSDADGHPRLRLRVNADGKAAIEFLDASGHVTETLPR
jgi:alpha-D-ribose 1-methylphosphonate 5-triphosphate synthase subunit PhnG